MISAMIDISIDYTTYEKYKNKTKFFVVENNAVECLKIDTKIANPEASHGGLCMDAFMESSNKNIDFFIMLKSDNNLKSNVDDLILALKWCIEKNVSLISLSMGTTDFREANKFGEVLNKIKEADIIFISGISNDGKLSYPACLDGCIGIGLDFNLYTSIDEFAYSEHFFNGSNVIVSPKINKKRRIGSTSLATAYFSGIISNLNIGLKKCLEWLKDNLNCNDIRLYYKNFDINQLNIIIAAIAGVDSIEVQLFIKSLQKFFIESDYYCLKILSKERFGASRNLTEHTHVYDKKYDCTYKEYLNLILNICEPSILFVELDDGISKDEFDVLIYDKEKNLDFGEKLLVDLNKLSPEQAFKLIVNTFI